MSSGPLITNVREAAEQGHALLADGRTLIVTDFDGTIAGLVADPWSATIVPAARRALRRLAARDGVEVAFLSGRTALDLADRVRVGGSSYLGDHGSQRAFARRGFRPSALRVTHDPVDPVLEAVVQALVEGVPRAVPEPWLVVEDKGAAVTFHVRTAPTSTPREPACWPPATPTTPQGSSSAAAVVAPWSCDRPAPPTRARPCGG